MSGSARICQVEALDCRLVEHDWAFAREEAERIDVHWQAALEQRPSMFNGRVFLTCGWSVETGAGQSVLRARHFETDFKAFLAFRDFGFPDPAITSAFAAAALRCSDGAFVLGRMGDHTANGGLIYFPAGTPDPSDVREGRLDLESSVRRELAEETGLIEPYAVPAEGWTIVSAGPRLACIKSVHCVEPSRRVVERIEGFLAQENEPELAGVHRVASRQDLSAERMPDYVLAFFEAQFSRTSPQNAGLHPE